MIPSPFLARRTLMSVGLSLLALSTWLPARPAQAQDIFNDIPGHTFSSNTDDGVINSGLKESWATAFTPTGNYTFGSVTAPLQLDYGPNMATMNLYADQAGRPGAVLESITLTGQLGAPTAGSAQPAFVTFTSALAPTLTSGEQYWIGLIAPGNGEAFAWYINPAKTLRPVSVSSDQGASWYAGQSDFGGGIDVHGIPAVPEPAPLIPFGLGGLSLGGLVLTARRRKAAGRGTAA